MVALLAGPALAAVPLDPHTIPKFVTQIEPLPHWTATDVNGTDYYEIDVAAFTEPILPPTFTAPNCTTGCPTPQYGYGGIAHNPITGADLGFIRHAPSGTFEATRFKPTEVKWINNLGTTPYMFAVDPTLHWADPNKICTTNPDKTCTMSSSVPAGTGMCMYDDAANACMFMCPVGGCSAYPPGYDAAQIPTPIVTHLHGAEVQSTSDGGPEAWWTGTGLHGKAYNGGPAGANYAVFHYDNAQPPTNLWYHDHALGMTRTNVMSGLAGFYFLREPGKEPVLPSGKFEQELVFQDRAFMDDGTLNFPYNADNPDIHPYWLPEFFGDTITVNGDTWPNMNVTQDWYRLRLLDGSNARFYNFYLINQTDGSAYPFYQIGTDGGYLAAPVQMMNITFAPGERTDVLIDFSQFPVGTQLIFNNSAAAPYPMGDPANFDPTTTGIIMQFTVTGESAADEPFTLPATLSPIVPPPNLASAGLNRTLTLKELEGINGPLEVTLNGQKWGADISELPALGTTEDWWIVDLTPDAHPIHTHLTQFQLISREDIDVARYEADWMSLNGNQALPFPGHYQVKQLPVDNYLMGNKTGPDPNEMGWKDTIKMYPGQVSHIRIRFAPIDGTVEYPFPASVGPGYVWHCHIIDHEDNEMMRPYAVTSSSLKVCKENVTRTGAVVSKLSGWDFVASGMTPVGLQTRSKQTTNGNGCTNFTGLMPGDFTATETLKDLWINMTPTTQAITIGANDQAMLTFKNRYMDLWCGKKVAFWQTEVNKYLNNNPNVSRTVCPSFFNAQNLQATGYASWRQVYNVLVQSAKVNTTCPAKASAQKLVLKLDRQYYDDGLKFRVDTSKITDDSGCKAIIRTACGGKTQCSIESIFANWPANCLTAQKLGQCLGNYTFGCMGKNFPPNYCTP